MFLKEVFSVSQKFLAAFHNKQCILYHDLIHTKLDDWKIKLKEYLPLLHTKNSIFPSIFLMAHDYLSNSFHTAYKRMTYILKNVALGVLLNQNGELRWFASKKISQGKQKKIKHLPGPGILAQRVGQEPLKYYYLLCPTFSYHARIRLSVLLPCSNPHSGLQCIRLKCQSRWKWKSLSPVRLFVTPWTI